MQFHDWNKNFDQAYHAYNCVQYGLATVTAQEQEDAALSFLDWIEDFRNGGVAALNTLERELQNNDIIRRNTAGYILIEIGDPDRLHDLSQALTKAENHRPILSEQVLKRLWTIAPPINGQELFWDWVRNNIHARIPLIEALLSHQSELAEDLCTQILSSSYSIANTEAIADLYGETVIRYLSRWKQTDRLKEIIEHSSIAPSFIHGYGYTDLRLNAALYLGLAGDENAVSFLEINAEGQDQFKAVEACRRLSLLAQPSVIEKLKPLLASEDGIVVATALDASSYIKAIDLIPDLLDLANREVYGEIYPEPLCDDALRTIGSILGQSEAIPPQEQFMRDTYGTFGGTYTREYRLDAIDYYREYSKIFDYGLRYEKGKPLTLEHLINNLFSGHSGPYRTAAFNLPAITGHHYDLDVGFWIDRIDNIKKILLWKDYAAQSTILKPGGWAYQGQPLNYP